jgi:hypothetical protein
MFNSGPTRYTLYVFFISFVVSSTCFGCYLHPSSGVQLPRAALGCVWFWCVIPLEQVLILDSFTLKHGQLQTNDERNKEYSVHLVGPELNIYTTYVV